MVISTSTVSAVTPVPPVAAISLVEHGGTVDDASSDEKEKDATEINLPDGEGTAVSEIPPTHLQGPQIWILFSALTLVFFLVLLDISIVATAAPQITTDFESLQDVGWYGSAYLLASAAFQPLTGKFYSHFSTKWTFLVFFIIFEIGSLICGVSRSSNMFICGRAVAGLGASAMQNGALTIIAAAVPLQKRPVFMGILMGCAQVGIVCGPVLGGLFTEHVTWRWCFFFNLPVGAVAGTVMIFTPVPDDSLRSSPTKSVKDIVLGELDLTGFAIFAPAMVQILLALQWGGYRYNWNSPTIIGLLCGGGVMALIFTAWEHRQGDRAMIPLSLVGRRHVWSGSLMTLVLMGCLQAVGYYLPLYFQTVRGATPTMSGVYGLPNIAGQLVTAVASGLAIGRFGYYLPWSLLAVILTSIASGLISMWGLETPLGQWIGHQLLNGAGRGCGMQVPMIAIQNALVPAQIPIAMSILVFSQNLGGSVFVSIANAILSNSLKTELRGRAPLIDQQALVIAGASAQAVRNLVAATPGTDLTQVLISFSIGFNHVLYFATGVSAACIFLVFPMGVGKKVVREEKGKKGKGEGEGEDHGVDSVEGGGIHGNAVVGRVATEKTEV